VIGAGGSDRPLRELALATGFVVAAPPMRLAPEHRYPAAFEDSLLAARWLAGAALELLGCEGPAAVAGDYVEFADGYGFSREKSLWCFRQYRPDDLETRDPRVSPLFERDLAGLPPTLVISAECDPLRDEGERYAREIRSAEAMPSRAATRG
jgi:acetyl esterase/lipase